MKELILLGGGLDSSTLLVYLKKKKVDLYALFFQYGQKAESGETKSVKYFCKKYKVPLKIIKLPIDELATSAILRKNKKNINNITALNCLEGRNIIFISLASTYAITIGANKLYLGYHIEPKDKPFPDATIQAIKAFKGVLKQAYRVPLSLEVPFVKKTRYKIFKLGLVLDKEIYKKSFTCYENATKECGKCAHCKLKKEFINKIKEYVKK